MNAIFGFTTDRIGSQNAGIVAIFAEKIYRKAVV